MVLRSAELAVPQTQTLPPVVIEAQVAGLLAAPVLIEAQVAAAPPMAMALRMLCHQLMTRPLLLPQLMALRAVLLHQPMAVALLLAALVTRGPEHWAEVAAQLTADPTATAMAVVFPALAAAHELLQAAVMQEWWAELLDALMALTSGTLQAAQPVQNLVVVAACVTVAQGAVGTCLLLQAVVALVPLPEGCCHAGY